MHAAPGAPVGVEDDIVIESHVTGPAMRPHRPTPRRLATRAGAEVGGGIIARHRLSKAAASGRIRDRHGQTGLAGPTRAADPRPVRLLGEPARGQSRAALSAMVFQNVSS